MTEINREWIASELCQLLVALASPGDIALDHSPPGSCRPDELALDYDNFVHAFVGNFPDEISTQQRDALLLVNALFAAMSDEDLWTEAAVVSHSRWVEVRAAAQRALDVMSWRHGPLR